MADQLSFLCLETLGKINKSLKLSLWKPPLDHGGASPGKAVEIYGGMQGTARKAVPARSWLPLWIELTEAFSWTPSRPLFSVFSDRSPPWQFFFFFSFLVTLWPKDTSFTYVISTGWWWGSSGQRLSIDNALANTLKPCCLIPRASTTLCALKVTVFPGSPVVKTSWSPCRPPGLIPDQGIRSHMPQWKVLHATAKIWHSPIKALPVFSQDSFVPQL